MMFNDETSKLPFSNQALESMFAHIRRIEDGRYTFGRMLILALIMGNHTICGWLRKVLHSLYNIGQKFIELKTRIP